VEEKNIKLISFLIAVSITGGIFLLVIFGLNGVPMNVEKKETKETVVSKPIENSSISITKPIMFNTPEADAIISKLDIWPPESTLDEDISEYPVSPDSDLIISNMNPDRHLWYNLDMCYIIVPPDQKKINVKNIGYVDESDPGPYPIPDNAPIEGWPIYGGSLENIQRNGTGDRHCLILDPVNMLLYEFFGMRKTDLGWEAMQASIFDLKSNVLRPKGWTSADAAGLPIMPLTVRYDEVESGIVKHAIRFTVRKTRRDFIPPATHYASRLSDKKYPRMGERVRLKKDVDISGYPPHLTAILKGLKKYGMIVADNGMDWLMSIAPDERIKGLERMKEFHGRDFEVVQMPKRKFNYRKD